jgi:DNA-binding winged helix-turn-helix (wHTH) protein
MDSMDQDCVFTLDDWRVEPSLNRISRGDEDVRLEPLNMKLLAFLAARPGAVISHDEIERAVWTGLVVTPGSIYQSIAQLRRALGDDKAQPRYIETVARRGYRLVASVRLNPENSSTDVTSSPMAEAVLPQVDELHPGDVPSELVTQRLPRFRFSLISVAVLISVALVIAARTFFTDQQLIQGPNGVSFSSSNDGVTQSVRVSARDSDPPRAVSRTELLIAMADDESHLNNPKQARAHYEEALALQRQVSDGDDLDVARILARLAQLDLWDNDYVAAEAKAREAVRIFEHVGPALNPNRPRVHRTLAEVLIITGRYAEAGSEVRRSLELSSLLYGESHIRTIEARASLARLSLAEGRLDEAEAWARQALDDHTRAHGNVEIKAVWLRTIVAAVLLRKARYAETKAVVADALELVGRIDPNHPHAASAQHMLGEALIGLGEFNEAESALLRELELLNRVYPQPWRIARAKSALGEALLGQGRIQEAEANLVFASRELDGLQGSMESDAQRETARRMEQLRVAKKDASSSTMARAQ